MLLHIHAPHLPLSPPPRSLWNKLHPQVQVAGILLLVCAIALTPNFRWYTWAIYGVAGLAVFAIAKVPLQRLVKQLALEWVFVCTIALGAIFNPQGTILWQWGWLQITTTGLLIFASVLIKALLSLLLINVLVLTLAIPDLLAALGGLGVPPLFLAIAASMHRYLTVLLDEFQVMQRAAAARNLTGAQHWRRIVAGNMIGALFIRTYERGNRIYQAMLARGYQGLSTLEPVKQRLSWLDSGFLAMVGIWILCGQMVYIWM